MVWMCVWTLQEVLWYRVDWHGLLETTLGPSSSPVSPLVDLPPLPLGPETPPLSPKETRLCWMTQWLHSTPTLWLWLGHWEESTQVYTCTVANNKPSRAAVNITIVGMFIHQSCCALSLLSLSALFNVGCVWENTLSVSPLLSFYALSSLFLGILTSLYKVELTVHKTFGHLTGVLCYAHNCNTLILADAKFYFAHNYTSVWNLW